MSHKVIAALRVPHLWNAGKATVEGAIGQRLDAHRGTVGKELPGVIHVVLNVRVLRPTVLLDDALGVQAMNPVHILRSGVEIRGRVAGTEGGSLSLLGSPDNRLNLIDGWASAAHMATEHVGQNTDAMVPRSPLHLVLGHTAEPATKCLPVHFGHDAVGNVSILRGRDRTAEHVDEGG